MKVYIGPYVNYFGPYQFADLLQKVGVSEDRCYAIGSWLSKTWVSKVFSWIDKEKTRKIRVCLHNYDTWSMDSTLAVIILPMLTQLQKTTHGAPLVDDNDVPELLRSTSAKPKENEYDIDNNHFKRWDWVLDEMIWAFQQLQPDADSERQFYSGEVDYISSEPDDKGLRSLGLGPNHTFKVDQEALDAHNARIDNALRLFGKYYRNLWD